MTENSDPSKIPLNTDSNSTNNIANPLLLASSYDYHLPDELIARYPLAERSASRLMYIANHPQSDHSKPEDKQFTDLPELLNKGDLIVFNDTKVMKARLFGQKPSGGKVEVLIEKILSAGSEHEALQQIEDSEQNSTQHDKQIALCYIRANKSPKANSKLQLTDGNIEVDVLGRYKNLFIVRFNQAILPLLEKYGELPIPPYFERQADETDDERYQTVFHNPEKIASVASPTASLHFDDGILQRLRDKGVQTAFVTLHVGAGTFAPVKTDNILEHTMHSEYAHLPQATADLINQTHKRGNKVISVGTTVTRVLESAYKHTGRDGEVFAWSGDTDIFIYPSFQFAVVDRLITNFHLPKSTLLMLVSAFSGKDTMMRAYQHAIEQNYRFFSYGDSMLLDKNC